MQKQPFPDVGTEQYAALRKQAMQFLVQRCEFNQRADELGVAVTDADVDKQLQTIKAQYFGKDGKCDATCEKKYRTQIAKQGLAEAQVREDVRASVVQNKLYTKVTADVTVEDSDIDDYYKKNKDQYVQPESRDVRHILVKKKALADDLYQQLKSGGNFAALAKKYSQDPGSKASGGKLTISKGRQVPEFDKAAFALAVHAALAADQDAVRLAHHRGADQDQEGDHDSTVRGPHRDQATAPPAEEAGGDEEVGRRHLFDLREEDDLPGRLRAAGGYDQHPRLDHAVAACRSRTRSSSCRS